MESPIHDPDDARRMARKSRSQAPTTSTSELYDSFKRFTQRSHATDYLGLLVLAAGYIVLKLTSSPFKSQFRLDDPRIQHPHAEIERVPVVELLVYAVAIPLGVLSAWAVTLRPELHKIHVTFLGFAISILTTLFLTDLFKDAIGRPRPDLLARCKPAPHTPRDRMVSIEVCTEERHHTLQDGWRSYPSGHSSFSFAGLGWIALLFASQLHVLRPRANLVAVLLCLLPLVAAALIAISRLEDYRHDVFDVVSGSVLGFGITLFHWRRYYHPLTSDRCDEAYQLPNGNGRISPGYQRARDDEEGYVRETPDT